jgi:ABC-2 type transport system ATP-binding protein
VPIVETLTPLVAPDDVFNSTDGVESWRREGASSYVLIVTDPRNIAPHVNRALVAAGADVVSISESRHSLEDVYLQLIDDDPGASQR